MSSEVTPDNCRDTQEAIERNAEAQARVFESNKRHYGEAVAEKIVDRNERARLERIKVNERELERSGAINKLYRLKDGKTVLVTS